MRALLDSHALIWWLEGGEQLADSTVEVIANAENDIVVSAASVWEIELKRGVGRLIAPDELLDRIASHAFELLAITPRHAVAAARLPRHHDDPFDRMLVAQAQVEGLTLVTRDRRLADYEVALLRA